MQRVSRTAVRVLTVMLRQPRRWIHGYELLHEADVQSGTLYPLLARLHEDGWLETKWAESPEPGRPPRHLYRLTSLGVAGARAAADHAASRWPSLDPDYA